MVADKNSKARVGHGEKFLLALLLFFVLLPIGVMIFAFRFLSQLVTLILIWIIWGAQRKENLVVYSDSPHWKKYFEEGLLPQIENRSHVLNWSERSRWRFLSLKVLAFNLFGPEKEYNPMIMRFSPFRWPKWFCYYQAFNDFKHGKENSLIGVERRLDEVLGELLTNPHPRPSVESGSYS